MMRKIIKIDEEKCIGCGLCAEACHEGAIKMVDGIAKLIRDDYCDGLGDCLPVCPEGAINFIEREAKEYNHFEVLKNKSNTETNEKDHLPCSCPGSQSKTFVREDKQVTTAALNNSDSYLTQWPVQLKLAPINAPYFNNAKLLIAADCTAFAYGDFHRRFIKGHVTLIGCPKLDSIDYSEKLTEIIKNNNIQSVTVVKMEVPCCGKMEQSVKKALQESEKFIPWQVVTISTDGKIIE